MPHSSPMLRRVSIANCRRNSPILLSASRRSSSVLLPGPMSPCDFPDPIQLSSGSYRITRLRSSTRPARSQTRAQTGGSAKFSSNPSSTRLACGWPVRLADRFPTPCNTAPRACGWAPCAKAMPKSLCICGFPRSSATGWIVCAISPSGRRVQMAMCRWPTSSPALSPASSRPLSTAATVSVR